MKIYNFRFSFSSDDLYSILIRNRLYQFFNHYLLQKQNYIFPFVPPFDLTIRSSEFILFYETV